MARRSSSRGSGALRSSAEAETLTSPQSPQLKSIDLDLAHRIKSDPKFRERYFRAWAANEVATELRTMRKRRALRQQELAEQAHTGQSAISRIEQQDYDGWTFKTLLNIAVALKARLRIRLEPFEDVAQNHETHETADALVMGDLNQDVGTTADDAAVGNVAAPLDDLSFAFGNSSAERAETRVM